MTAVTRKRLSAHTGSVTIVETTESALNRPEAPPPTTADLAAQIVVPKTAFCLQFRAVYAAEGSPAGALIGTADAFIAGLLAALPAGDGEAITDAEKIEAMERWAGASAIERSNPLIDLLAPILFGDADALSDSDDAVVIAELTRVAGVSDQLFIDAEDL